MVKVFISYRRIDSGWAGRIHQSLGRKRDLTVLRDTSEIRPGEEFPRRIQQMVEDCDVVIVLIGRGWIERIDQLQLENDWVRREIIYCMNHNKPILPILVDEVTMPARDSLPDQIQVLASQNASRISDEHFDAAISDLAKAIQDRFRQLEEDSKWNTLNGLRGALNLALRHSNNVLPRIDPIRRLAHELVPDLFLNPDNETPTNTLDNYELVDNDANYRQLLLRGVSYRTVKLNEHLRIKIGVRLRKSEIVGLLYEELSEGKNGARLIIVFYSRNMVHMPDTSGLLTELGEPQPAFDPEYRLPYKSVFFSKIGSSEIFRNTYSAHGEVDEVHSEMFVTLFDMKWIGSCQIQIDSLDELHEYIMEQYGLFTLIHAIEYRNQTII